MGVDRLQLKPDRDQALMLAKRSLPELVYDAVNLEGIHYTLPEVQTLLAGVTVGGHSLCDQTITLNQRNAWQFLFDAITADQFALTKDFVCALHAIAAKDEALKWGQFRDGLITISGTDYTPPVPEDLDAAWTQMVADAYEIDQPYDQAIFVFLHMARNQFFFDVNKRMGRFMMNGLLLNAGYPAINLPAKRQLTFNTLMLDYYPSGHAGPMTVLMKDCLDERILKHFVADESCTVHD